MSITEDITRVTVISPTRRVDLALPASATLAELLPAVVRFSGSEATSTTDAVHAWVLQRLGEDPLDGNKLIADLQIRDGETLHLRQREQAMPDAAFDDVVDAVATSTSADASWQPGHGQRLALLVLGALLILIPGFWVLKLPGLASALTVLGLGFSAAIAAVVVSRAFGIRLVAITFAWASVVLAGLGGYAILTADLAVQVLIASAAVLFFAAVMALGAQVHSYQFFGIAVAAVILIVATMVMVLLPGREIGIAAVVVVVVLLATPLLPMASYRIAQVALPTLPGTAEELVSDATVVQPDIVARALTADRILGGFLLGSTVAVTVLAIPVIGMGRWWDVALGAAISLSLLLRARAFTGLVQRLALVIGGVIIGFVTIFVAAVGVQAPILTLVVGTCVLALAALILGSYAATMYRSIVSPWWGRWGDILEWLALLALVPLVLQVLDLYFWAFGLWG